MSSAAGLSRRRVPASASTGDDDADSAWGLNGTASNGGSGSVSRSESLHSPSHHAGSAFEGGSKIAYDPRDLEREDEDARLGGKPPRLTIMEEVLLLGLKDKQVSLFIHSGSYPRYFQPPRTLITHSLAPCSRAATRLRPQRTRGGRSISLRDWAA